METDVDLSPFSWVLTCVPLDGPIFRCRRFERTALDPILRLQPRFRSASSMCRKPFSSIIEGPDDPYSTLYCGMSAFAAVSEPVILFARLFTHNAHTSKATT